MDTKIFKTLAKYESQLKTAKYCDYARGLTSTNLNELAGVFETLFQRDSKLGKGCGKCQLKDLKQLADEYFNEIKRIEMEKIRKAEEKEAKAKETKDKKAKESKEEK